MLQTTPIESGHIALSAADVARFRAATERSQDTDGCWLWRGSHDSGGYGCISINDHTLSVHRLAYQMAFGTIPPGFFVCHRCDVRNCVRPDHLFLGTAADNMHDMWRKGRGKGHLLSTRRKPVRRPSNASSIGFAAHPELIRKGEDCTHAKLTAAQVRTIRQRAASGESSAALGRAFHVTRYNIDLIVQRRTWAHVTDAAVDE